MTDARPTPTLLVFTLGAAADRARRPLLPEPLGGTELALRRACLAAAVAAGRETGCRVEVSSPRPLELPADLAHSVRHVEQAGCGFGARLAGAMAAAFESGAGPVVVVGGDVPGLTADHLQCALERLEDDPERVVVGPSPDGGFYLLAAARPVAGLADRVVWCCGKTLATLKECLAAAGRPVELLEPLADLDRPADLERWLAGETAQLARQRGWRPVLAALVRLLAAHRRPATEPDLPAAGRAFIPLLAGRSPPDPAFA